MSVNGFVFNFINDLKVTINVGGGRKGRPPSFEQSVRGFVALGLAACIVLIVAGLAIAGGTAGVENPHPMINKVYVGLVRRWSYTRHVPVVGVRLDGRWETLSAIAPIIQFRTRRQ